ncbi:MAG: Coenzyme F420 hydrogenase/dehydrogenase, beta subunit C-terminal domain [Lachnospiraceae bacterium]|nr:Coenzyme F420 hydrogenase/dehydrogenase, beta subunit C-terminal domain [Lachnospiraceae bacterium]
MTELYQKKENCYGCGVCANLCPHNALSMQADDNGFVYPVIHPDKCIHCGACQRVCPAKNDVRLSYPQEVYAAAFKDAVSLYQSSSGGIFPALSGYILSQGGVVFGAAMQEKFTVETISIHNYQDLPLLQGSKYVQSNPGNSYREIRALLSQGKTVLFCGTPCQVAGLKEAVTGLDKNLISVDLVCHGVPSQQMFQDYIAHLECTGGITIKSYRFRDKKHGQDDYYSYTCEAGGHEQTVCKRAAKSSYFRLFLDGNLSRESCYHCKFAVPERVGDLTLCDYWGIEKEHPSFAKELKKLNLCGVSGVLINTEKGKNLFEKISSEIIKQPSAFDKLSTHNNRLLAPVKPGVDRNTVLRLYREEGYKAVDDFYFSKYFFKILRGGIGSFIPLPLRKRINRLLRKGKGRKK